MGAVTPLQLRSGGFGTSQGVGHGFGTSQGVGHGFSHLLMYEVLRASQGVSCVHAGSKHASCRIVRARQAGGVEWGAYLELLTE